MNFPKFIFSLSLLLTACKKEAICVCTDQTGRIVEQSSSHGSQKKRDEFESECSRKTTQVDRNGVIFDCEVQ